MSGFYFPRKQRDRENKELENLDHSSLEDFKNDKQAVEYQQRIVDILLKVSICFGLI